LYTPAAFAQFSLMIDITFKLAITLCFRDGKYQTTSVPFTHVYKFPAPPPDNISSKTLQAIKKEANTITLKSMAANRSKEDHIKA
jgi:hypothetical protein